MKIAQLSVFLVNEPGRLRACLAYLSAANVNITALSLADTKDFGILRLIVPAPDLAKAVLEGHGYAIKMTEVVALEVADDPGGLADILEIVATAGVNIEYLYAARCPHDRRAAMIFRFDDPDRAIAALNDRGINPLADVTSFHRDTQAPAIAPAMAS